MITPMSVRAIFGMSLVLAQLVACGARTEFESARNARSRDAVVGVLSSDVVSVDATIDADGPDARLLADVVRPPVSDAECNPATVQQDCLLALHATQDPEAVFQCCDGHCESGSCDAVCNGRACDVRDGWFCCFHSRSRQLACSRRDRGLCGEAQ